MVANTWSRSSPTLTLAKMLSGGIGRLGCGRGDLLLLSDEELLLEPQPAKKHERGQ